MPGTRIVPVAGFGGVALLLAGLLAPSISVVAWVGEILLLAAVVAHAHRMTARAAAVTELEAANRLLTELHELALHQPLATDPAEVLAAARQRAQKLLATSDIAVAVDGSIAVGRALSHAERSLVADLERQVALGLDNARRLSQLRALAVHAERARIARELHDQLGQDLAGLGFLIDSGADNAELREAVGAIVRRLRDTLTDLRSDVDEDHDLTDTLAAFLSRVTDRSGLSTRLELPSAASPDRLPPVVERELLRITQEAVVNAERHSGAQEVRVLLDGGVVEIRDDGIGLPGVIPERHYGLMGMRERAEAIGGELEIESAPGRGTTVRCRVEGS
jgi:signal transduction histidine kinase